LIHRVILEIRQQALGALFLELALELAPGRLARDAGAAALARVEVPHQLVDVEGFLGAFEFVGFLVFELFFRLFAHARSKAAAGRLIRRRGRGCKGSYWTS